MSIGESVSEIFSESTNNDNIFTIGATVDTGTLIFVNLSVKYRKIHVFLKHNLHVVNAGFEWEAIDECREKLGKDVRVVKQRGRIYFNIDWDQFPKVFFYATQIIFLM